RGIALAAAVAVELEIFEHRLGRPLVLRLIEHAGEGERGLEEGPAIETVEVHRRRLDAVVDLQRVALVRRADERAPDGADALADRERLPGRRLRDQLVEFRAALKDRGEGER